MNDNEESEIMQDFGQMLRTVMGSGLQAVEQAQRRAAKRAQEQAMNEARERGVAQMIGKDFASDKFWRSAGSAAIADRMTLSLELATKHGASSEAARAFMTGADRIRNQFGINVEDLNRDHPTAATDRHHALRDALDEYLSGQRAKPEQPPMGQEPWFAQPQGTFRDYDYNDGLERHVEISKEEALRRLELMPADTVRDPSIGGRDTISFVPSWYGHDDDVDRAIAEKFPHLVPEGAKLPPQRPTAEAVEAQRGEATHLGQAERAEGEEHLDRANAETAEAKEVRTPPQAGAGSEDAGTVPLNQHSDASQRILSVWREKSGGANNPSLAQAPTLEHSKSGASAKRPKILIGQTQGRGKEQGLSR